MYGEGFEYVCGLADKFSSQGGGGLRRSSLVHDGDFRNVYYSMSIMKNKKKKHRDYQVP